MYWFSLYTLGILSVSIYRTHKKRSGVDEKGIYPRSIHFEMGYVLNLEGWEFNRSWRRGAKGIGFRND